MKIYNFGSLNLDYVYQVDHFVKPGETISSVNMQVFPGGKGLNQSVALARSGAKVLHAGKIGEQGEMLLDTLTASGVDVSLIKTGDGATGHAIIQVDKNGQNCIVLYGGTNRQMDSEYIKFVLSGCKSGDILLLQNEINNLSSIIEQAHEKGALIALNPSPFDDSLLKCPLQYVRWFLMNELEGMAISNQKDPDAIVLAILAKYPGSAIVLTLGKDGVLYADKDCRERHGIFQVPVVDTTAAGDTFTGYFIAGVAQGLPIKEVLRHSSLASSLAVSRKGAASSIPSIEEVLNSSHFVG